MNCHVRLPLDRTALIAIFIGLLVVMAGCTTTQPAPVPVAPAEENPTPTTVRATQTTHSATTVVTSTQNNNSTVELENLTSEKREEINDTLHGLYDKVNESNRQEVTTEAANKICEFGSINVTLAKVSGGDRELRRIYHGSRVWNEYFSSRIDPEKIDQGIKVARKAGKYAPIAGSYNRMHEAACAYSPNDTASQREFYIAATAFGIEMALIQNSVFWRGASTATRTLSHTAPYKMVQSVFGDSAYGFMMSETYWVIHGSLLSVDDFIIEHSNEMNVSWDEENVNLTEIKSRINTTHLQNVSVGDAIPDFSDLRNETSLKEIANCAKKVVQEEGANVAKLGGMLWDGKLKSEEWKELPNSTKDSIRDCVLDNSTKIDS